MRRFPEEETLRALRRLSADRWAVRGVRGVLTRGRTAEASVNVTQLAVSKKAQLRVLGEDLPAGATLSDVGKFVFVTGYSEVGGDDFIPES